MIKTRKMPKARLQVTNKPRSLDLESKTVEAVFSTGAAVRRRDMFGPFDESLVISENAVDMSRLIGGPVLRDHTNTTDSVIGTIANAWIEDNNLVGTIRFHETETAQDYFERVQRGELRSVSVGYDARYSEGPELENGVPHYQARNWSPLELSIVALPADHAAMIRSQEIEIEEKEIESEPVIETRSEQPPITEVPSVDELEKQKLALEQARKEAAQAEKTRSLEIRKAVREAKLDDKLADELIDNGTTIEQARTNVALLVKYAKEQEATRVDSTVRVQAGTDEVDKKRAGIIDATLARMDRHQFKTENNPFVGKSLLRNLEAVFPRTAFESDSAYAKRAMSSSDLPYILANVAEKQALNRYQKQPRTWSAWAKSDSLRNFKTADRVRSGDFASLEERQEGAEFKRGSFGEEREQVALKEYGKIMSVTRRMLINDDLGEIAKVMADAGSAAARLENKLVYAQLTSNPTMGDSEQLFSTAHANKGTSAVLTDVTIGEAFKLMREQTSVDGLEKLNIAPEFLICGPQNEVAARKYLATISPNQSSNVNVFSNSLKLIVDSEISTNDYYFASGAIDTVVLYHLDGEESPRIESRTDFETESVELKCAHTCVAKALDWRGLVINEGGS
jgi:phage head maturation protease